MGYGYHRQRVPGARTHRRARAGTGALTRPGPLSADYTTQNFFGGLLTITVPSGWEGFEDSTGELAVGPAGSEDGRVEFWIDVYAVDASSGKRDETVENTADAMTGWVASNPNLDILERKPATLGVLLAESFDWLKSADAINSDPDAQWSSCNVSRCSATRNGMGPITRARPPETGWSLRGQQGAAPHMPSTR